MEVCTTATLLPLVPMYRLPSWGSIASDRGFAPRTVSSNRYSATGTRTVRTHWWVTVEYAVTTPSLALASHTSRCWAS